VQIKPKIKYQQLGKNNWKFKRTATCLVASKSQRNLWRHESLDESLIKLLFTWQARNGFGDTALHLAAMNNYLKVAELLLESGASIDIENKERLKPIDITPQSDHVTRQLLRSYALKTQQQILQVNI